MSFRPGMRSFIFSIASVVYYVVGGLLVDFWNIGLNISIIFPALAILGVGYGIKEIATDPENNKAKIGLILGIAIIIFGIFGTIMMLFNLGRLIG